MNNFTRHALLTLTLALVLLFSRQQAVAQSILNPNDSVYTYNPNAPAGSVTNPNMPADGNTIGKWIRTVRLTWNTNEWKAYILHTIPFRLKFPKTYNPTANDGKKYPMMIFWHGAGEKGPATDNEFSLANGGPVFTSAVDNGAFDGYVLVFQTPGNGWSNANFDLAVAVANYMIVNNKLDPFRLISNGLSAGGYASWGMMDEYPNYLAASLPMSGVTTGDMADSNIQKTKFTPMWLFQGGLDGSPDPNTANQVVYAIDSTNGGNLRYTLYPKLAHGTWTTAWNEPDFWPFCVRAYMSNPWTLFGRTAFCPGEAINVTIGVAPRLDAYQWRKDGVVISGATTNTIKATATGTYDCRVQRGGIWSDWSRTPVVISIKAPTVTPPITVSGLASKVIPNPADKGVTLKVPAGYVSYTWQKVGSTTTIGTDSSIYVTQPGNYIVKVMEKFGCSSNFSPAFTVIDSAGPNKPDAASSVIVTTLSQTSLELDWSQNPSPAYNETNFEIYQATQPGGPYKLAALTGADVTTQVLSGLVSNTKYYYVIRAVNNTGASPLSPQVSGVTSADTVAPTVPSALKVTTSTRTSVSLSWGASTDNIAVTQYYIYVNGVKSYTVPSTQTTFTVNGLNTAQNYIFKVQAADQAGNLSGMSNQANAVTRLIGLIYNYYNGLSSTQSTVPDLNALTPVATGVTTKVSLSPATNTTQYAFLWQGSIRILATGTYTFQTTSDDGSNLYLGPLNGTASPYSNSAPKTVNNDGLHGSVSKNSAALTLQAGTYPIAITFFQQGGGANISVSWKTPSSGGSFVTIPDSVFIDNTPSPGQAPPIPTLVKATAVSYKGINVGWADNSNTETGFEVYRSTSASGTYSILGTAPQNAISWADTTGQPATTYYYKVQAINQYGGSGFDQSASATTFALPPAPIAPYNAAVGVVTTSSIAISWQDTAKAVTGFNIYRSIGDVNHFLLIATVPANVTNYVDGGLYPNQTCYYKVNAKWLGGNTGYSSTLTAKVKNVAPVITQLPSRNVRYGTTTVVPVSATGNGALTLSGSHLPAFAALTDNRNGTGSLTLSPAAANQGVYPGLVIKVSDANGGADSTTFNLTVNSNYTPVVNPIPDATMNEGDSLTIALVATDSTPSATMTFSIRNCPNNFTLVNTANGKANLVLKPTYAAAGSYLVGVNVNDGQGDSSTRTFNLTVVDKDPSVRIYARVKYANSIGAPWNSMTGINTPNLVDANGNATTVGINFLQSWWMPFNAGPTTGNNSGVYPDAVLNDFWYFGYYGGPETAGVAVTGLNQAKKYNLTLYAGSVFNGYPDNGTTVYTIGAQSQSLYVQNNTKNTVTFGNLSPDASGKITVNMAKAPGTPIGYLNALVITQLYDDGTAPAKPTQLTAQNVPGKGAQLNWQDAAYNETGYQVVRSLSRSGGFSQIGSLSPGAVSYLDSTISGATTYYYAVRAVNSYGNSAYTDTVSVTTTDRVPKLAAIADVTLKNNQTTTVNVTATDDATDHIRLTASGLPSFATFVDNGNGTGVINIQPTAGVLGAFTGITVTATDNSDSSRSVSFNLYVVDPNVSSTYVNMTNGSSVAPAPWNNLVVPYLPNAGLAVSGLRDDGNQATGATVTLTDAWDGVSATGMRRRNGTEVYPESVEWAGLYLTNTTARRITVSGLSASKKYNFVFFNSDGTSQNSKTNFTIGAQTVSLNGSYNSNKTVQINGITPDASGNVVISCAKDAAAAVGLLSALQIEAYTPGVVTTLSPTDLRKVDYTATNTISLQWQDRADNETGYQVWRSVNGGTYTQLVSLPANTTSYVNTGLTPNTAYDYIVRAVNGTGFSTYSNTLRGYAYASTVFINFNGSGTGNVAPAPWNNLNWVYGLGATYTNFFSEAGIPTNTGMVQPVKVDGMVSPGVNTGNNSGVFPDKVLAEGFGMFPGDTTWVVLTNLDLSKTYDITVTASLTNYPGENSTVYIVNGKTYLLNSLNNSTGTLTLFGLQPDGNGQLQISFTGYQTATFGLLGAMVIKGYTPYNNAMAPVPAIARSSVRTVDSTANVLDNAEVKAYPNPFGQYFILSVPAKNGDKVQVVITDMSGRPVLQQRFENLLEGINVLRIQPSGLLTKGMYVVRVLYGDKTMQKTIKLIKQ